MEILSNQATAVSKKDLMNTLTNWKEDLKLHESDYDDLKELFEVAKTNHSIFQIKIPHGKPHRQTLPWQTGYISISAAQMQIQMLKGLT